MRPIIRFAIVAGIAAMALRWATAPARAYTSGTQLVYSFTYSSAQNVVARDSATSIEQNGEAGTAAQGPVGSGSGMSHYHGNLTDGGTMTVKIVRQQSDGGLIVTVSEQGENIRRAPLATCVVYGNTQVICDPNKTVYSEEYTLLRFFGSNFVDPNQLDVSRHWSITTNSSSANVKSDYTIDSNANGTMQISETRRIRPVNGGSLTTDVQTKIGYDFTRAIPTSVDEYVTQRQDNGVSGTSTTIYQTTFALVSTSAAAAP
jgi:hypothetical protein